MNSLQQRQQVADEKSCFWITVKTLPVLFVVGVITCLTAIYGRFPLRHALTQETTFTYRLEMAWFFWCLLMLVISYSMALVTDPGRVPNTPAWSFGDATPAVQTGETKRTGERRSCKWCERYKPDRCHHCRVCRTCVLRMDHHCPWIYNCVGFRNHKYFFLLLIYTVATLQWMTWTMWPTLSKNIESEVPFQSLFLTLFGTTLGGSMALLTTAFLCFHIYLMCGAMTTIEFCEKQGARGAKANPHYRGVYANICAVLGPNPLLWLLPFSMPSGDGLTF
mmetsp:Transcript_58768/g.128804  ORF Transcript_58768/g.128804 Transcript_58768/m.128804 type:complete len:278 (+) Transcript_58768:133-966(+)